MKRISVPAVLRDFSRPFSQAGKQCWLVGGAVRDMVLGFEPDDYDVATDAKPEEVSSFFRSVIPTGIKHGTVTVRFRGHEIEVTTFRTERGYADGRHPDEVLFTTDIADDLCRRDFTMNALALDCASGELKDLHRGLEDIEARTIRAIGDPLARFEEDGLRPLRAVRFAAVLGFGVDAATLAAIPPRLEVCAKVSAERVRDELSKMLLSERPVLGLRLLESSGLMALYLPELLALRGLEQSPPHAFDALDHSYAACEGSAPLLQRRWAALLHDLGKPSARREEADGTVSFIGHERASAELARRILSRLKYPTALIEGACLPILHHMTRYEPEWTDAAVRRFVSRVGPESVEEVLSLLEADEYGLEARPRAGTRMVEFRDRIAAVSAADAAFGIKDLAIGGEDLARLGYSRGPSMGLALKELLEAVLDDPALNEAERLREIALRIGGERGWLAGEGGKP